jgi:ATP-binding cassette, subfamily B, bacterial
MYSRRSLGGVGMGGIWQQRQSLSYLKEGKPDVPRTLARVWNLLRSYSWQMILTTVVILLGVGVGLVPALLIRELIDTAIPQHNFQMVLLLGLGMLIFPLLGALLGLVQNYLSTVVSQGLIADLRNQLYRHVQYLGLDFFTWTRAGEIQTRFVNDASAIQNVVSQSFMGTLSNLVTVIGTLIVMFVVNWQLSIAAALALPAFAFPVLYFGKRSYKAVENAQRALGEMSVVLEETMGLSGALVIKSFGTQIREFLRFRKANRDVRSTQLEQALVTQWASVVVQSLAALGPAVLYTYGAYLVITHQVALGTIVAFATYLAQLYRPASSLAGANSTILGGLALFDRVFQFLDLPQSVQESEHPQPLPAKPTQGIAFENVSFAYVNGPEVLHDVSFVAPVGKLTALVGPSGAGKSTILSLAARFYDPSSGAVKLDGIDLRDISNDDLRSRVAVVTQDVFLFHISLRENLCYGAPEVSEAELHTAIAAAQLQDLVERLPDGLDTIVGERGYRLSGGEKQRVAIARALLRRAPYLLLDEATSSLDSQAERLIQQALDTLLQGRTVIAIAHRLSTIQRAEQILVVDQGRIVERGTHETLLQQSGLYQHLYEAQFNSPTNSVSNTTDDTEETASSLANGAGKQRTHEERRAFQRRPAR